MITPGLPSGALVAELRLGAAALDRTSDGLRVHLEKGGAVEASSARWVE